MDFKDLEELKEKLKEIKEKGFIKTHREGNTGIGKTLEDELNIIENNSPKGDFNLGDIPVELKAKRKKSSNRITLYTKEPIWIIDKYEVISKTAYKDIKGRTALKIILNTNKFNDKGFKLELTDNRIYLIHKLLGKVGYFDIDKIIKIMREKLGNNLLLVFANVQKKDEIEYFNYIEAIYFSRFKDDSFERMLRENKVIFEFRLHLNPSGSARDRGSGFRVGKKFLKELYEKEEIILSAKQK